MLSDPDIFRIRRWAEDLLIGPTVAFSIRDNLIRYDVDQLRNTLRQIRNRHDDLNGLRRICDRWGLGTISSNTSDARLIESTITAVQTGRLSSYRIINTRNLSTRTPSQKQIEQSASRRNVDYDHQISNQFSAPSHPIKDSNANTLAKIPIVNKANNRFANCSIEQRIYEIVERSIPLVRGDRSDFPGPSHNAQITSVFAVWAKEQTDINLVCSAFLSSTSIYLRSRIFFEYSKELNSVLSLATLAKSEIDIDAAAAILAFYIEKIGFKSFLAAIATGAERLSGSKAKRGLEPRYSPSPAPQPRPSLRPVPSLPPSDSTECTKAKQELAELKNIRRDADIADAAYTDTENRPAFAGYKALTSDADLEEIGLTAADLEITNRTFRAVVYKNEADSTYVVGFQGSTLSFDDWSTNASQGLNLDSNHQPDSYYRKAQNIATMIKKNFQDRSPPPIRFVGHSLGGGLASAAARSIGANASTFNAAGLHSKTVGSVVPGGRITAVNVKGEILTRIQQITPMPLAAADNVISLNPPLSLARDLLPILGTAFGSIPGLAAGIALRAGVLHKMGCVSDSLNAAIKSAAAKKEKACARS